MDPSGHLSSRPILLLLGIGVFGGSLGAWLFQRFRIPQVIGYLVIGLILGETGFGLLSHEVLPSLRPFSYLALCVIGFLVGGELESGLFRKYGRQFCAMMLGEGLGAFLLVGVSSGLLLGFVTGDPRIALAGALVFGAISSATDPASTLDVLWENRSKGLLTSSLVAVVALDDALAMFLYAFGTAAAALLAGSDAQFGVLLTHIVLHLSGSLILGACTGLLLDLMLRTSKNKERILPLTIGSLLLLSGSALALGLDIILAAMSAGILLVNRAPKRSESLFQTIRAFGQPLQIMFFVLVGARVELTRLPAWIWLLIGLYVTGRSLGKYFGTRIGGRWSGSAPEVRNHLGLGLLAQGGVAVGLSMMASQHLQGLEVLDGLDLGSLVVTTVTGTTLLVQLIGPAGVKLAIRRVDEAGRNITEEDLIEELTVDQVLQTQMDLLHEHDLLPAIFATVTASRQLIFPVLRPDGTCTGTLSLESIKALILEKDIWDWMIAEDVMTPCRDRLHPEMPLREAMQRLMHVNEDQVIVRDPASGKAVGIFDLRQVRREITRLLIARQRPASE